MQLLHLCLYFCVLLFSADGQSFLPFLNFETNSSVINDTLDYAEAVTLPSDFYFGNETYNISYISTHGLISFGIRFTEYVPSLFPIHLPVVSPFWDDSDLRGSGYVLYDVITSSDDELNITSQVNSYFEISEGVIVNADWVLVARWTDVCPYENSYCLSPLLEPNTFQVVLVSKGVMSFAVFTYKCGHLQWTDHSATIGYSASSSFYYNHPASGTLNVIDIDCVNSSDWVNFVYQISDIEATVPGAPNNVSLMTINSTALLLSWSHPSTGLITDYNYTCIGLNTTRDYYSSDMMDHFLMTSVILNGLEPFREYSCNVTAANSERVGPSSNDRALTGEAAPSGPPLSFSVDSTNPFFLLLSWSPPRNHLTNGIITSYYYYCIQELGSATVTIIETTANTNVKVSFTSMSPFTNYTCYVRATNSAGSGPFAIAIIEANLTSVPTDIISTSVSTDTISTSVSTDTISTSVSTDTISTSVSTDITSTSVSTDTISTSVSTDTISTSVSTDTISTSVSTDTISTSVPTNDNRPSVSTDDTFSRDFIGMTKTNMIGIIVGCGMIALLIAVIIVALIILGCYCSVTKKGKKKPVVAAAVEPIYDEIDEAYVMKSMKLTHNNATVPSQNIYCNVECGRRPVIQSNSTEDNIENAIYTYMQ